MNPPKPLAFRHFSAVPATAGRFRFAPSRMTRQSCCVGFGLPWPGPRSSCYTFPSMRPGPSQTGPHPISGRRANADVAGSAFFPFESGWFAVESQAIKNQTRGSKQCANPFFSSLFSPRRWPAACKTLHRVGSRAPSPVLPSPMRWTKTWSRAPLWAVWPVRPPAASKWACRPASRATDRFALTGQSHQTDGVVRAFRPAGPVLHSARPTEFRGPAHSEGEPCSRKS